MEDWSAIEAARQSAISFGDVTVRPWTFKCPIAFESFPLIRLTAFQTVLRDILESNLLTKSLQDFRLADRMVRLAFALAILNNVKFFCEGFLI